MKKQISRISILQSSKACIILYVLFGFLYTLIGIPMVVFGKPPIQFIGWIYLFGPLWMGTIGFIFFVISAAIYNLVASWVGGVEFEVKDVS